MCSRSKPLAMLLLPFLTDGSVVTWGDAALGGDSSIGAGSVEKCAADPRPVALPLLPSVAMDRLLRGVSHTMVATVVLCRIS